MIINPFVYGASGGGGPPADANILLLVHGDGANDGTIYDESSIYAHYLDPIGVIFPVTKTAIKKYGTASLRGGESTGTDGRVLQVTLNSTLRNFGTGDCGARGWVYPDANQGILFDGRGADANGPLVYWSSSTIRYYAGIADRITGSALATNTQQYVEWSRVSGTSRLFVDGTQVGSSYADSHDFTNVRVDILNFFDRTDANLMHLDDFQLIRGSGGNTSNYTPPVAAITDPTITTSVWNSADKDADVVLSSRDRRCHVVSTGSEIGAVRGTLGRASGSGVYQVEFHGFGLDSTQLVGLGKSSATLATYPGADADGYGFFNSGLKYTGGSGSGYGSIWGLGSVIGVKWDAAAGEITFYIDGASQGVAFTGVSGTYFPMWGPGTGGAGNRGCNINTGQVAFTYPIGGATAWG